ncbi:MAG TPA: DNA polymerase Y family protein [Acidimicrobiia bacterium]|nr:DNA polymerase Y family protein [Acidimicrobiia bacterium]
MARTLCIWFPDWPLRRPDSPPDRPCQVVDDAGLVLAATPDATAAGIRVGMRRREAEARCPTAVTLVADPGAEAAAFEPVALAIEGIVPRMELASPGLAFVPVAGAVRYYGTEGALVGRVVDAVEAVAPGGRFGLADGPFAARLAADAAVGEPLIVADTSRFLARLDVSTLGIDELVDTFHWLGVGTLGDLAALPRAAIASRFGPVGLEAHLIASGEDRSVDPRRITDEMVAEDVFDPPLDDFERAAFAARGLAGRLIGLVAPTGARPHRVEVEAESALGGVRSRTWRSAHPFSEVELAERVRWQIRAWVESGGVPGGIVRLRIAPADLSDLGRQLRLDEDAASEDDARRALSRAQGLIGPDAVLQAMPQGGRDPGERVHWYRWGEEPGALVDSRASWPGRLAAPSPALVPPEPRPLEVEWEDGFPVRVRLGSRWEPVRGWAGPWRRTGRWWGGESAADRYQIVTSTGAFLCEIREERCWLVGVYD